ncbi:MAG: type II toxin-antitoxin system VapB family antitoxin [Rhodomicrobium sp.]
MTIALPVDRETADLAWELARATGKPLQTIVREAIEKTAAAEGVVPPPKRRVDMNKIREILARIDALPVQDPRPADEIIGYDEFGLPR